MADVIPGFVKITQVGEEYRTSRSTIERRRDTARDEGQSKLYRMFRLRTKDGEAFTEPSKEHVAALAKQGKVPEWFVSRSWLEKEFGKKRDQGSRQTPPQADKKPPLESEGALAALQRQYDARIEDLKQQLAAEKQEKKDLIQYAQADKQLFAKAAESLTQVLALPGITEATKAQRASTIDGSADDKSVSTAASQNESPKQEATKKPLKSAEQKERPPKLWHRLLRRRHES